MLYFAYNANIEPNRLSEIAPGAEFQFIAHLPEWRLHFPIPNGDGGLPSVYPESGNTVWGAVFEVPNGQLAGIHAQEAAEGREPKEVQAMDREGRRHKVLVHVCDATDGDIPPARSYLQLMVSGGRHWSLPAGWVASLEEHLEDF